MARYEAGRERREPSAPAGVCGLRVVTDSGPWGTDWSGPCMLQTDSTGWHNGDHRTRHGDTWPQRVRRG